MSIAFIFILRLQSAESWEMFMVVAQEKVANFIPAPNPVVHTVLFSVCQLCGGPFYFGFLQTDLVTRNFFPLVACA